MNWTDLFAPDNLALIQRYLSWVLIVAAFIWGGWPERAVAATWLICFKLVRYIRDGLLGEAMQFESIDVYWAFSDLTAGVAWIVIALYANRNYTLGIAGLQVLAMAAHVARGLAESISPIGYVVMVAAPGWIQLFLLLIGLTRHILRKREHGEYRDWRISKPDIALSVGAVSHREGATWEQASQPSWRDDVK